MSSTIPTRKRRILMGAAAAVTTSVVLAACSGGGDSTADSDAPAEITVAVPTTPVSLDPALQTVNPTDNWFIALAYDPLIRIDNEGELVPDLATEWEYLDENSTQFQLTIREGVQFNDGSDLDANDVVASLEYFIASGVNGGTWLGQDTTVEATDDYTVLITSATPNSVLPYLLTQRTHLGSVISEEGLEDPSQLLNGSYGAGPYMLDPEQTIAEDTYTFVANPNYWAADEHQHFDTVTMQVTGNAAASLQAVQSGVADLMRGDVPTATTASTDPSLVVDYVPLGFYGVSYLDREGTVAGPLADVRVRQALSYAIDRDSIMQAVWGEYGTPGNALTLEGFVGFTDEASDSYAYDPERARELLAEAGYEDGFSFDMMTPNSGGADVPAQAIVQNWAEIGVTANLTVYSDTTQLINDTLNKQYPVGIYYYGAQQQYLQAKSFFNGGANQYNAFESYDEEIFENLDLAAAASSPEEQQEYYGAALDRATIDLAWFSTVGYTPSVMIAGADRFTGLEFNSLTGSPDLAWEVTPAE